MSNPAADYAGYDDLRKTQIEGFDYRIHVRANAASSVAVIAPHGGRIEPRTSDVARKIAGDDFNLYLLEGIRPHANFAHLHLTSHKFDEPRCLDLLSRCDHVIAVHGCDGEVQRAFMGGRDEALKARVAQAIAELGVDVQLQGHRFPATNRWNICNRGRRVAGIQIEMTVALRRDGPCEAISEAIRAVLLALPK